MDVGDIAISGVFEGMDVTVEVEVIGEDVELTALF